MSKPALPTYPAYYEKYINLVPGDDLRVAFSIQRPLIDSFLATIDEAKSDHAYAPGKWTLKELLQHVIDTERIFAYRALCFSRKEKAALPGFDENEYIENAHAGSRSWKNLCEEFLAVRKTTEILFDSFSDEMISLSGNANNNPITVNALGFIILGHFYHHKKVAEERYL